MKRIKLLLVIPKADDPTSFYRAYGPLAALGKEMDISYMMPSAFSWATISINDICFMQRPADPNCLIVAEQAKLCKVPLWLDFDDDNLSVPKKNPTSEFFGRWDVKDAIVKCARLADIITVSTEHLRKRYSVYNKSVQVISNCIDDRYLHIRDNIPKRAKDKVIAWRGGPGFEENIKEITPAIISVAKKYPAWKFIFMGNEPSDITEAIKNYQVIQWLPVMDYFRIIVQLHATAFFHCVKPNDHSLSRSHGPWLEASFAGSMTLAKNLPEFQRPGCLTFDNEKDFEEKLEAIIKKEINADQLAAESWEHVQNNFLLSKVNFKRREIIEGLLSR